MINSEKLRLLHIDCLQLILRPIVRYCVRRAQSYQDFIGAAKVVFVQVAEEEILKTSKKVNVSRISAITGIYRDDVTRLYREKEVPSGEPLSVLARVLGQWEQDERFINKAGKPRVLTWEGKDSEFQGLVETVSKHLNPGTILFELIRAGSVEKTAKGLKRGRQLAASESDFRKGFELLAHDLNTLVLAVEDNILEERPVSNLHIRTEYDNIFYKDLPKIRKWLVQEGKKFHRKARNFLAKFDSDIHPVPGERAGAQVVVTAYSLTSPDPEKSK